MADMLTVPYDEGVGYRVVDDPCSATTSVPRSGETGAESCAHGSGRRSVMAISVSLEWGSDEPALKPRREAAAAGRPLAGRWRVLAGWLAGQLLLAGSCSLRPCVGLLTCGQGEPGL